MGRTERMRQSRWLLVVLLLGLPTLAFGQAQTTSRITGKVTDDQGAPIAGATITVNNDELKLERSATSSSSGEYLLAVLPTGSYTVTVEAAGKQPQAYKLSLGVGQTAPLNVSLAPGEAAVTEEITVTGNQTALETTSIGQSFHYREQVEQLPLTNRTIDGIAQYSPNVAFGPSGDIAISGAPSFDTTVLLDGAEISDPYFGSAPIVYLEDAIEEVQVLTSGVSARYGRFQGGVINAITKSGGNEFTGTLRSEFRQQSWNSQTPFEEEQSDDLIKTYQATLGGYVVKDRLWFFVGGRTIPTASNQFITERTSEPFSTTTEQDRYQAKLRGAINANHLVALSYLKYDQTTTDIDLMPIGDDRALGNGEDARETWALSYQGVLSSNTFLELTGTTKKASVSNGGDPSDGDPFLDLVNFLVYNNSWFDSNDPTVRDNETAGLTLTHSLSTGSFGTHTIEGGVQYVNSITGGENRQSSTGYNLLTFNDDFIARVVNGEPRYNLLSGGALRWVALPLGGDQELKNRAVYLQDTISLDKWRFDLGLRYEDYEASGPLASFSPTFHDLAPRLGITYSVNPNWQIQGFYGRYVSRFNDAFVATVTSVGFAPRIATFYFGPDLLDVPASEISAALRNEAFWPLITAYVSPTEPTSFLADDISAPHADEYNLSVRHALPRNSGHVVLGYVHRDYKDLIDDFVGGACDYGIAFGEPCPASDVTIVPGDIPVDTTVWANNPRAKRQYRAINLVGQYRPSTRWQFGGNYTYSKTEGNYEGEAAGQPASGSPFGDYERSIDVAAANPSGFLSTDIRNRAFIYGNYRIDFGERAGSLSIGSDIYYQSGRPYNLVALVNRTDVDEYVAEAGTYTHYFGDRGSRRFNGFWRLDLSTRYELPIFSDVSLFLKAAVINVHDNDEVIGFSTSGRAVAGPDGQLTFRPTGSCGLDSEPSRNCTGFGRIRGPGDYQAPRAFLLTLGLDF